MKAFLIYLDGIATLEGWARVRRGAEIIFIMWLPGIPINYLVSLYLPVGEVGSMVGSPFAIISGITFLPLAETYGMRLGLFILRKGITNTILVCVLSGIGWGFLHSIRYWGLYAVWPFFVMSYCYLRLERNSIFQAMLNVTLLHCAANVYATVVALVLNHFFS